jgi:hypothetical protein
MAPADNVPRHQDGHAQDVWVYPSEQQFFNAMKRKVRAVPKRTVVTHASQHLGSLQQSAQHLKLSHPLQSHQRTLCNHTTMRLVLQSNTSNP